MMTLGRPGPEWCVQTTLRMNRPIWCSIQRLIAGAANYSES